MKKRTSGMNIFKEFKDMGKNAEATERDLNTDVVGDRAEALHILKKLIEDKKETSVKDDKREGKWEFSASPHHHFGKTLDDTFEAFLSWARMKDDKGKVNVSRALRRLELYANAMYDYRDILGGDALDIETIKSRAQAWAYKTTVDSEGRLVWWVDSDRMNPREFTTEDYLQTVSWYSHAIMYHEAAQKNGIVIIQSVYHIGMKEALTLLPPKVATKVLPLALGVLPIRLEYMYYVECPRWVNLFFMIIGLGQSKKKKERFIFIDDWSDMDRLGGLEAIPKDWGNVEGLSQENVIEDIYFGS
ncbi:hypothetical protein ACHAWF_005949 [Thalassiosira exigua]